MVGEFSTIPEGTHWGLNDEGVAGLWIHDLELFLEENKAEIERCLAEPHHINNCDEEGDHILSANGIRKCTIKEEENNE